MDEIRRERMLYMKNYNIYRMEDLRINSFYKCSRVWKGISILKMTAAGFYYVPENDTVRCFDCMLELTEDQINKCPYYAHREHNRYCDSMRHPRHLVFCRFINGLACGNITLRQRSAKIFTMERPRFDIIPIPTKCNDNDRKVSSESSSVTSVSSTSSISTFSTSATHSSSSASSSVYSSASIPSSSKKKNGHVNVDNNSTTRIEMVHNCYAIDYNMNDIDSHFRTIERQSERLMNLCRVCYELNQKYILPCGGHLMRSKNLHLCTFCRKRNRDFLVQKANNFSMINETCTIL